MSTLAAPLPQKTWLDRLLSVATEVKPREAAPALVLMLNVFLLLSSYYLLKTIRGALIISEEGARIMSYASAGQALLLLLVIPAYGALASRVNRVKLITGTSIFFASNLVAFYLAGKAGVREGVIFFLWLGIYNNFIVGQFWAFANDLYTEEQGKRLFPVVGMGSTLGAWVGSLVAKPLFAILGPYGIMLTVAGVLMLCITLTWWTNAIFSQRSSSQQKVAEKPLGAEGGFELIFRDKYLMLVSAMILLLNLVNTTGEFVLATFLEQTSIQMFGAGEAHIAQRASYIAGFYGDFYLIMNLLCFLMQTFVASRLLKYLGVRGTIFILPVIAFGGYGLIAIYPILAVAKIVKIMENAVDYSIQNTANQALFLTTSREAKYKAKAAIDTFVVRTGDMLQAGLVFVGVKIGLGVQGFASVAIALTVAWLSVVGMIYREHLRRESLSSQRVDG